MIREWWEQHMDARRAFSLVLAAVAIALVILALALTPGFATSGTNDIGGLGKYGIALGGSLGRALRGYLLHRSLGVGSGLRWALAQGGSMALLLLGMFAAATAIGPIVSANPTLGGDAWMGIMAIAVVIGTASNDLWERNARRRRIAALFLLAVCLVIVGLIALRSGGLMTLIGAPALAVGIIALVAAVARGFSDLKQELAETSA